MSDSPKVIIRCLVYNHEPFLRDCLEGFVMQQTNFPFKAVVHDDCSTDGSAAIIREYAEKYPDIIEPIYETENQYSKRDGSLRRIMDAATLGRSPYLAYCEGDDYWTDPLKLQKQVDYMDKHPDCTMTCTNVDVLCPNGLFFSNDDKLRNGWFLCDKDSILTLDYIISHCAHTCTLVIKSSVLENYPDVCRKCYNGDYMIQIIAAIRGTVFSFTEKTAVYRYQSKGSFTERGKLNKGKNRAHIYLLLLDALEFFNQLTSKKHQEAFYEAMYNNISYALNEDHMICDTLCRKYGHILLTCPQDKNIYTVHPTIPSILYYILLRIKWFPFKIGHFIRPLKKYGFLKRIHFTYLCIKSSLKNR